MGNYSYLCTNFKNWVQKDVYSSLTKILISLRLWLRWLRKKLMWSVLIALSVGIVFASLLYLFNKKQALAPLLFAIRTIAAALLTLLLINPIIKNKSKIIEQPIIIIAQDISSSIVMTDDSLFYKHDFQHIIDSISNTLEEKYNVERYYFGDKLYDYQEPDGNDYTDINAALSSLKRMYYKQNVGAVVLLSDESWHFARTYY